MFGLLIAAAALVEEHRPWAGVGGGASGVEAFRLRSWGSRAWLLRSMWNLLGPGVEPVFPALASGFLSSAHQGRPPCLF